MILWFRFKNPSPQAYRNEYPMQECHSYTEDSSPASHFRIFAKLVITRFRAAFGRPKQPGADDVFPVHCKCFNAISGLD